MYQKELPKQELGTTWWIILFVDAASKTATIAIEAAISNSGNLFLQWAIGKKLQFKSGQCKSISNPWFEYGIVCFNKTIIGN